MQVTDAYVLAPGECRICGGNRTPAIDTLREIDTWGWDGRLYICHECAGSMAQLLGWVPPDKHGELLELTKTLKKERDQAVADLEKKTAVLDAMFDAGYKKGADGRGIKRPA